MVGWVGHRGFSLRLVPVSVISYMVRITFFSTCKAKITGGAVRIKKDSLDYLGFVPFCSGGFVSFSLSCPSYPARIRNMSLCRTRDTGQFRDKRDKHQTLIPGFRSPLSLLSPPGINGTVGHGPACYPSSPPRSAPEHDVDT